ncbi:MAG: hypothetical protein IJT22_05150 [Synergistaceae bacterium]|nr:hypothetical protein [Synergistaceae bacterium]
MKKFRIYFFPVIFAAIKIFSFLKYVKYFDLNNFKIDKIAFTNPAAQLKLLELTIYMRSSFDWNKLVYVTTLMLQALAFVFIARLIRHINKKPVKHAKITSIIAYAFGLVCGYLLFIFSGKFIPSYNIPFAEHQMLLPFSNILISWLFLTLRNVYFWVGVLGFTLEVYSIYVIYLILKQDSFAVNINEFSNDEEIKYQEALALKNNIENSLKQSRLNINNYSKLVNILISLGDYKDATKIKQDTLAQLKNIRSKLPTEIAETKLELLQKLDETIDIIEKNNIKKQAVAVPDVKWGRKRDYFAVIFVLLWALFIYEVINEGSPIKSLDSYIERLEQKILARNQKLDDLLREINICLKRSPDDKTVLKSVQAYFNKNNTKQKTSFSDEALNADTLKLEYPAMADKINIARTYSYSDKEIRQYFNETEVLTFVSYGEETEKILGRTPETWQKFWEAMEAQQDIPYIELLKDRIPAGGVQAALSIAKITGIAPALFFEPENYLKKSEQSDPLKRIISNCSILFLSTVSMFENEREKLMLINKLTFYKDKKVIINLFWLIANITMAALVLRIIIKSFKRIRKLNWHERNAVYVKLSLMGIWWYFLFFIPVEDSRTRLPSFVVINDLERVDFQRLFLEVIIIAAIFTSVIVWRKFTNKDN